MIDRRMMLMALSGGGMIKSGTFVGNGTTDVTIDIGFEPDVLIIDCDLDFETAGWIGTRNIVIVKDSIIYISRHNNATQVTANSSVGIQIGGNYGAYGSGTESYVPYGTYANGKMSLSNPNKLGFTYFINEQSYTWTAIKYE